MTDEITPDAPSETLPRFPFLPRQLDPFSGRYEPPTIRKIQLVVADHFGVTMIDMLAARRTSKTGRPKQIAMYLSRELTFRSLSTIGRAFRKDRSTIANAARRISELLNGTQTSKRRYRPQAGDATLADDIAAIKAALS